MEKSLYPVIAAASAILLTAAAISASIIYVTRQSDVPAETYYSETAYTRETKTVSDFDRDGSFTTPYGTFTPIDSVLDINEYMTQNPVMLTAEKTLPYISRDGESTEILETIKSLSDEICRNSVTDYDKAKAIAMWVGVNTAYDFDAGEAAGDLTVTNLEAVIENGFRTTCGGFSNLYSALCSAQGIYCLNMKGGTPSEGYPRSDLENAPANHEWNGVLINGEWYYADCTWISDLSYRDGETSGGGDIKPFYALFSFGEMSTEHRIDRCEYRDFGFEDTEK